MIKSEIEARIKYFRKIGKKATDAEYKARLFGQAYGLEMAIDICENFLRTTTPKRLKCLLSRFGLEKHTGAIAENISTNLRHTFTPNNPLNPTDESAG